MCLNLPLLDPQCLGLMGSMLRLQRMPKSREVGELRARAAMSKPKKGVLTYHPT
jgi:hypothetical protein